ncbi:hypothetical protein Vadar_023689 [Vaccinium darrowii]|uniref:Uncharacterized protein n=1 Tax=Vaccinium darrowii TaxID=229202 RepID=A0ACB7YNV6_9ERIC|nr:hypothetical protein Vadar_023689 [Vaccinium darrowii]
MSYSEALKGGTNVNGYSKIKSVIVAEVTDSWLQRSAIAKLKSFQSIKAVHKLFFDKGFKIAQIKPMGGLNLVITFHSIELLDSLLAEENLDFSNWFVSFQKWNGQACPPSRNVWLSCFGVPLNVWCDNTFLSIGGLWGDVVALEEKTQKSLAFDRGRVLVATNIMDRIDEVINLSINGALAKVRVIEDLTSYFTSSDNYNFGDEIGDRKTTHSKIVDEEDDMAPDLCKLTHAEGCKINSQAEVNARKDCTNTDSQKSAIREDVSVVGETPINNIKAPSDVTPLFVDLDSGASQTNNVEDSDLLADGTFFGGNSPTLTDKGKGEKRVDDSIEVAVCEEDDIPQAVKKVKIPTPEYEDQEPSWSELPFHKEGLCPVKKKNKKPLSSMTTSLAGSDQFSVA